MEKDQVERYEIQQDETGYQNQISYSHMVNSVFEGRKNLHQMGRHEDAYRLFYSFLGDFSPIFDDEFITNFSDISENIGNNPNYKSSQRDETIYRLHVAEFSYLLERKGITPRMDTTLSIQTDDAPKNVDEVLYGKREESPLVKTLKWLFCEDIKGGDV